MEKFTYYYISYLSAALLLSLIIVPFMRGLSFKLGAVDKGTGRRVHEGVIPRLGGVGIYFAFMLPMVFFLTRGVWGDFHRAMTGILIASTIVFFVGVYDDVKGSIIRNKLIVEILAALIIYAWGIRITTIGNPFGGPIALGWMSLPVTVLWIIVITNAINLIDGVDGLTAGTGILIAGALFFFLSGTHNLQFQLTLVVFIGTLLGFLRYNFPPASIFMGDSGSLFVGFFLGSISILSSQKAATMTTLMIPMLIFGFPLMDMLYAVMRRYYRGVSFGEADKEHIHHKLLEKGLSKQRVILLLYSINIAFMFVVMLFIKNRLNFNFAYFLLFFVTGILGLRMLGYIRFTIISKEIIRNYQINKKRKYFNYMIKRFRHNASKSTSIDDFKSHLRELMEEYKFNSAEIHLDISSIRIPFFKYNNKPIVNEPISFSFPIVHKENYLGKISMSKEMNGDYLLCTADMAIALSEEISRFMERNDIPSHDDKKN